MPTRKKRTKAQDLPKSKQELTPEQAKRVQGSHSGGANFLFADGSVKFATDGTSNTVLPAVQKK